MGPLQAVGADQFLEEVGGLVVHDGHMVGIPADGAGDMEHQLGDEQQQGSNLVGDVFRLLVVAGVEGVHHLAGGAVAFVEVHGADRIAFQADAEELGFDAAFHAGKVFGEDFVEGGGEQFAIVFPPDREVLRAVMDPDVHDAGVTLGLAHGVSDAAAALGVFDPEIPDGFVGIGQGQVSALGVGEGGGVEIQLEIVLLGPLHPAFEVLGATLVAVHELAAEVAVDFVEVHAVVAGKEGLDEFEVAPDFVDVAGASGVVAGGLDAAGKGLVPLEADDVVGLPAVEGNLLPFEFGDGFVRVNAEGGIALPGNLIGLEDLGFFHGYECVNFGFCCKYIG